MEWPFNKINYMLFGIGIIIIVIGYLVITFNEVNSTASINVGPLMLFLGYCIIIPISIIYNRKNNKILDSSMINSNLTNKSESKRKKDAIKTKS